MSLIKEQFRQRPYTPNGVLSAEIESLTKANGVDAKIQQKLKYLKGRIDDLEEYLETTSSPETPLQTKIWQDTMKEDWNADYEKGITSIQLGQFLRIMAEMMKAERILEIGMFTGYSAVTFAQSSFAKEIVGLELEPYCEKFMRERIGNDPIGKKIRVISGPGLDGLKQLKSEGKKFDLIFIDADKPNYINYYKYIMDNSMLDSTGAFIIDNTLWSGEVYPEGSTKLGKALHDFNEFVRNDDRVIQVIVPLRDGVTMIKPKLEGGIYGN